MDLRQFLVLLLIFLPLERLLPLRGRQRVLRRGVTLDSLYLVLNSLLIGAAFAGVLWLALEPLSRLVPADVQAFIAGQPLWLQVPAAILIGDLGFYLHHRLFHTVPALWRFHAVHHSIRELDWLAAHRVHPVDQLASSCMMMLPLFALGFSAQALAVHGFLYFLHSHLLHSNTRLGFGWLDRLVASPRYHHWHHARTPAAHDRNFGGQTLIWDRLFGTLHLPAGYPTRYGTDDAVPAGLLRQLLNPFLPRRIP